LALPGVMAGWRGWKVSGSRLPKKGFCTAMESPRKETMMTTDQCKSCLYCARTVTKRFDACMRLQSLQQHTGMPPARAVDRQETM
jgi:hypothetical protein